MVFYLRALRVAAEKAVEISPANASKNVLCSNLELLFPDNWKFKSGKKLASELVEQIKKVGIRLKEMSTNNFFSAQSYFFIWRELWHLFLEPMSVRR